MATYPGMNLRGEVRESVSLDEDDLSDVEDEVFIRDGKNGYKFEDISVKKPLMAPRRKIGRNDLGSRIRNGPPCKAVCKVCCYGFIALSVLIVLIVLVVILVSLFPLPINRLKNWIISKASEKEPSKKVLPCNDLSVTDVWSVNFPNSISESFVQVLDVNGDGVDDVILGFGTGDDNLLPAELFCNMFMGIAPPCQGGIVALNGSNGGILWRYWLPSSVFSLVCRTDVNGDNMTDCLVTGRNGIFLMLNPQNGMAIWQFLEKDSNVKLIMDVYWANFVPDQDNDTVPDILASRTSQQLQSSVRLGQILFISGKTGKVLQTIATPNGTEIYYAPQLLLRNDGNDSVLFGTGSPTAPGNLSIISLKMLLAGNMSPQTIYEDRYKGVVSQAILVDISGDNVSDIVSAMFNSTVVAIDGATLKQLWNFTVPNSETLSIPTPGYFNDDNVTDFLVKYQTGHDFPTYYYSQTFMLDGKTGKAIYAQPIVDTIGSQMAGLTLQMESYGLDFFLYWTADCKGHEANQDAFEFVPVLGGSILQQSRADLCKLRFNSSTVAKLYAINQFEQPPGVEIYNSENRVSLEYNNSRTPVEQAISYLKSHPEERFRMSGVNAGLMIDDGNPDFREGSGIFRNVKYESGSALRHKDKGQNSLDAGTREESKSTSNQEQARFLSDYEQPAESWAANPFPSDDLQSDYAGYFDDGDSYSPTKLALTANSNRDPRSKSETQPLQGTYGGQETNDTRKTTKKNLSQDPKYGIYGYKNVERARSRLLHDLSDVPAKILSDAYFKKREGLLRKSRFEQRDLKSHEDRIRENEQIEKQIAEEKAASRNRSQSLWDLESEKERQDKEDEIYRGKREINVNNVGIPKFTSVGALTSSANKSKNSIDLILVTYWLPSKKGAQVLLQSDFDCINVKLKETVTSKDGHDYSKSALEKMVMKKCLEERGVRFSNGARSANLVHQELRNFPYYSQLNQVSLGQMTLYRLQLECVCNKPKKNEHCARISAMENQRWASYLGKFGDGVFPKK